MKHLWQIFVLWGFWVLILWPMAPCLDPKPESAPQGKLLVLVLGHCNCPWFKFRKSGCPSETLNSSLCYYRVGEWGWYAECYGKMMEYLKRATESRTPHAVLWWLGMNSASGFGKMWKKVFKGILRLSVSHFHFYCGTCTLVGNSKILWASGLGNNINQWTLAFGNASSQGSWRQLLLLLLLLLLKLSGLACTSDAPSEEILEGGPVS
uniref:Chromosome 20 open reading frame 173 n=1 Tax=Panthera leo TaxID=9689 RepID=A0A8C8Y6S1_PANLE